MLGVLIGASPPPPPLKLTSAHPRSSATSSRTFGRGGASERTSAPRAAAAAESATNNAVMGTNHFIISPRIHGASSRAPRRGLSHPRRELPEAGYRSSVTNGLGRV